MSGSAAKCRKYRPKVAQAYKSVFSLAGDTGRRVLSEGSPQRVALKPTVSLRLGNSRVLRLLYERFQQFQSIGAKWVDRSSAGKPSAVSAPPRDRSEPSYSWWDTQSVTEVHHNPCKHTEPGRSVIGLNWAIYLELRFAKRVAVPGTLSP